MASDPVFPLYYRDFMASTAGWEIDERGAYLVALMIQWEQGSLPVDPRRIRMALGVLDDDQWERIWDRMEGKFPEQDGCRRNRRLLEVRKEITSYRRRKSDNGKKGAAARWGNSEPDGKPDGKRIANHMAEGMAEGMAEDMTKTWPPSPSPSPSSSPSPSPTQEGGAEDASLSDEKISEGWERLFGAWPAKDLELEGQREFFLLLGRWRGREGEILRRGLEHAAIYAEAERAGKEPKVPSLRNWCKGNRWSDEPDAVRKRVGLSSPSNGPAAHYHRVVRFDEHGDPVR